MEVHRVWRYMYFNDADESCHTTDIVTVTIIYLLSGD